MRVDMAFAVKKETPERAGARKVLLKIMDRTFWIGFYSACLLLLILTLIYGGVMGKWGPLAEAMRDAESSERGEMQPDEQPDSRHRQRG